MRLEVKYSRKDSLGGDELDGALDLVPVACQHVLSIPRTSQYWQYNNTTRVCHILTSGMLEYLRLAQAVRGSL